MTPPSLFVDHIVVPRLHNAFGPIAAGMTRPRVFEVDGPRERVTAFDVSGDPDLWDRSLQALHECIWQTLSGTLAPAAPDDPRTMSLVRELIEQLRRDYRALVDAHGPRLGPSHQRMWRGRLKQLDSRAVGSSS